MSFSKLRRAASVAFAITFALVTVALIASATTQAQEQQQPAPEGEQAAPPPAEGGAAAPAQEGAQPSAEQPAPDAAAAPEAAPTGGSSAEVPPVQSETPAATAEPAAPAAPAEGAAGAITASQVQIGAAVFGADGAKIGEVNGVKSDDSGKIQEILVTDGMPAGINAKVFEVPGDKITSVGDGVKLSLSSEEAKKLPIIDNSKG